MKKVTVFLAHSMLKSGSVMNKTIMDTVQSELPSIKYRHLDTLYPDGKIDVAAEQKALLESDVIVLQFPVQWYHVPALMKAWMDSVLAFGFAFGPGGDKLKGKTLCVIATTGSDEASYSPSGYNNRYLKDYLFGFENSAGYMGMTYGGLISAHCAGVGPDFAEANKKIAVEAAKKVIGALKS
ncbi:MAG: NAD(P)H-dependent oxidoreductase [Brevinema sp.]